jgi:hypothetical protein
MPDEHHATIFPISALRGLRWLFAASSDAGGGPGGR